MFVLLKMFDKEVVIKLGKPDQILHEYECAIDYESFPIVFEVNNILFDKTYKSFLISEGGIRHRLLEVDRDGSVRVNKDKVAKRYFE